MMNGLRQRMKRQVNRALERDRSSERYVEAASTYLWPWREPWLVAVVTLVALLDYTTTYAVLELSGKAGVYEVGWLASWALRRGGFGTLFLVDMVAVIGLALVAVATRHLCLRFGFKGFGRAMFVILLVPYAVVAFAAVVNNLVLTFL